MTLGRLQVGSCGLAVHVIPTEIIRHTRAPPRVSRCIWRQCLCTTRPDCRDKRGNDETLTQQLADVNTLSSSSTNVTGA